MSQLHNKMILQEKEKGKRRRGRQKKRSEDNIKKRTGMDFASSTRAAENRTGRQGIVVNSSMVPRLWYRIEYYQKEITSSYSYNKAQTN